MTTGVDCKTCKLIVLENNIASMTEFKQIIGRGTRLKPDYGKEYFTIMDFRNVSRLFADPDFDGEPVIIYEPEEGDDITPPELDTDPYDTDGNGEGEFNDKHSKYRVSDVKVRVISERVQYYDKDGKLITESLKDYSKKNIKEEFEDLDAFLRKWNSEDKKQAIIEELVEHGVLLDALREEIGNPDIDDFDLICHIAYDKKPLTRSERVNNVKKRGYLYKYSDIAQKVLESLLDKYSSNRNVDLTDTKILELKPFEDLGNPIKIVKAFGGKKKYIEAIKELEKEIYA